MRGGRIWFAAGAAVLIGTYALASAGDSYYVIGAALVAGLYALALGAERILAAWWRGRAEVDRSARAAAGRGAVSALALAAAAVAGGAWVHAERAPYWRSVRALSAGAEASTRLRASAERQTAAMQRGVSEQAALDVWRHAVDEVLPLRGPFSSALEGARWLAAHGPDSLRTRAQDEARFYELCLEWMDHYAGVDRTLRSESLEGPPGEWVERQNDVVERIQRLQDLPPPAP